mmetsp:Transcript_28150/g.42590  ORF Transcript_28150/g.42590 Transcript_28150/m.42590 type:complete len:152 (+) Transcript_28150:665-1120(+)
MPQFGGVLLKKKSWTLRELVDTLKTAYCGKIGLEFAHVPHRDRCTWIRNRFELMQYEQIPTPEKVKILDRLYWADEFASFISKKFNTKKRFGLEGVESFIPGMKSLIDELGEGGANKVIIGMPHRGRLNMLANIVRKPLEVIFAEFHEVTP